MRRPLSLCASFTAALVVAPALHADWRDDANARIEQHRKAELVVKVVDPQGRPVPGAQVELAMSEHAFGFGTAVNPSYWVNQAEPHNARYRAEIARLFNRAVLENGHKWSQWEDAAQRHRADVTAQGLRTRGLDVRGHAMIWQRWDAMPADVYTNRADADYLRQRALDHIAAIGAANAGKVTEWDVVNEHWAHHELTDRLNPTATRETAPALVDWFHAARAADADARLYINDYGILASNNQTNTAHQQSYFDTIQYLQQQGAPIGGIGFQSHFGSAAAVTEPTKLLQVLDRFATFGVPLQVTEFDMYGPGWTEAAKADYLRDFLTVAFSHEAVDGFVMWGFWDGKHWQDSAPLFDADWNLKPSGQAFVDLVFGEWWTQHAGVSAADGRVATRGFLGRYDVAVTHGDLRKTFNIGLGADGRTLVVTVPEPASAALALLLFGAATRRGANGQVRCVSTNGVTTTRMS